MQLMPGGTMGVVYGAAGLWQWKITAEESSWTSWASQNKSWKDAMQMEGSKYIGLANQAIGSLPLADMEKRSDLVKGKQPLLVIPSEVYISYLNTGGSIEIKDVPDGMIYYWFDPKSGEITDSKVTKASKIFEAPSSKPFVLIVKK